MFRFAHPLWLLLLPLIPVLALLRERRTRLSTIQYSDLRLMHGLPRSKLQRLQWVLIALRAVALMLLVFAMARPQSGRALEIVRGEGVDIVMALDMSGSMAALDFEPRNRLEAAKQVIDGFIDQRQYDRIGLVVFSREAFTQSPPTIDYPVLRRLLAEVELATNLGLEDGTAIGLGIAQAANMLKDQDVQSRVIILLTDGVSNAGQVDPLTAARAAAALGIKIYTVGVARPGLVPVPAEDGVLGSTTRLEESKIDEETLQRIADETGGLFFRATDTAGLGKVYDQIDELEKSEVEIQVFKQYQELAGWFLGSALVLVILELLLRHSLFRTLP